MWWIRSQARHWYSWDVCEPQPACPARSQLPPPMVIFYLFFFFPGLSLGLASETYDTCFTSFVYQERQNLRSRGLHDSLEGSLKYQVQSGRWSFRYLHLPPTCPAAVHLPPFQPPAHPPPTCPAAPYRSPTGSPSHLPVRVSGAGQPNRSARPGAPGTDSLCLLGSQVRFFFYLIISPVKQYVSQCLVLPISLC